MAAKKIEGNGFPLRVPEQSIQDIWRSEYMGKVRRDMLDGVPLAECAACYRTEKGGGTSYRMASNRRWLPEVSVVDGGRPNTGALTAHPTAAPISLQLMPGNVCNLSCRMCSPNFSSRIATDLVHSAWAERIEGRGAILDWSRDVISVGPILSSDVHHRGLHGLETFHGEALRWTDGRSAFMISPPESALIRGMRVSTWDVLPTDHHLKVRVNGREVFEGPSFRDSGIEIDLPWLGHQPSLFIELDSDTIRPANDTRTLGIPLRDLTLLLAPNVNSVTKRRTHWYDDFGWSKEHIFNSVSKVRHLYFTGGEPMVMKYVGSCLDYLIQTGDASLTEVDINSNMTVLNNSLIAKMAQFAKVNLSISVDGYGPLNDYIRYPSDFFTIERNIETLKSLKLDNVHLQAISIVQVYNVLALTDIAAWLEVLDIHHDMELASGPWLLNIAILPRQIKNLASFRLKQFGMRCKPDRRSHVLSIANLIDDSPDNCSPEKLNAFLRFTNDLDNSRNQNMSEACPELWTMIATYLDDASTGDTTI